MIILDTQSPLRELPASVPRNQALFFDGIRFSIQMAGLAYHRLLPVLQQLAIDGFERGRRADEEQVIAALIDAWTVIDSLHRLRELVRQTPGVKQRDSGIRLFFAKTADVTALRNRIQHINQEVLELAATGHPLLGVLSWATITQPATGKGCVAALLAGSVATAEYKITMPWDQSIQGDVGFVSLEAAGTRVMLADVLDSGIGLVRAFEEALRPRVQEGAVRPADVVLFLPVDATRKDTPT